MITGNYWQLLDDAGVQRIDAAAVRLLERSGCRVEHDGLLDLLEGIGCRVERAGRRCRMPEKVIRKAVRSVSPHAGEAVSLPCGWSPQQRLHHGGSYPQLLEWPECRRRLATRQDVVEMARLAHVLPEFDTVGRVLTCAEVAPRVEPLWTTLTLAQTTDKRIGGGEIFHAGYIEPLVRMGEVLSGRPGDTSLVAACDFFIAPLILDPRQAECFLEKRRFGIANVPGTMPISGISGPVTVAGTVAIAVAELLAGWVIGYAVDPSLPVSGIVATGSLDVRTTMACFGSPEALLQDFATVQVCRRLYGIEVSPATSYVDCKTPGLEATFQKMLPLVAAPFGLPREMGCAGLLAAGQCYSPVQHLLEAEMNAAVRRFWGTFDVSDDTLALDLIEDVMRSGSTSFLDTEHTAGHYRTEQWYPRWLDRTAWQGDKIEAGREHEMLHRIDDHVRQAIRRYEPPARDAGALAELERIYRHAEARLAGVPQLRQ